MYELLQVSEKCYYINCPAKIGVYVADGENVYLVDSGNDKDAGFIPADWRIIKTVFARGVT